ncbi:MAG: RNA polymerase factor sigma-32 [Caulobacter sp.]|nr:RNA polymerase factor sigma-32 [Caulobacter sp.]
MATASEAGPVERRFMREAMRAPLLNLEREQSLARRWRDDADDEALQELTGAYMRLVIAMAAKFRRYGLPMADLVQEGAVGLMQAADRFDPDRGVRFSTYAGWWVRAAMQDFVLRNWSIVRTGTTASGKSLFFKLRGLRARLGDLEGRLTGEARTKIAAELGVEEGEVEAMAARMGGPDRSLDAPITGDGEEDFLGLLPDERDRPDQVVEATLDGERRHGLIGRSMAKLTPRERSVIEARRLVDDPVTLEALGVQMGVSKERVRQIEQAALAKMRASIEREVGDPVAAGLVG